MASPIRTEEQDVVMSYTDHHHPKHPVSEAEEDAEQERDDGDLQLRAIKEKARSLQRPYDDDAVSTTTHEKHLHRLSDEVWGGLYQPEDGAETETQQRSFVEMCELYPNIAKEMKQLSEIQPALKSYFSRLDDRRARSIEEKLDKVNLTNVKILMKLGIKVEAPKAKIRKKLVNLLVKVARDV